jgi:hypothetical protein
MSNEEKYCRGCVNRINLLKLFYILKKEVYKLGA